MQTVRSTNSWWLLGMVCLVLGGPGTASGQNVAFITSVTGGADLGDAAAWPDNDGLTGAAAADAVCRNRAQAAGLANPDRFRAWISDSTNDAYCRVFGLTAGGEVSSNCGEASLPTGAGPWVRTDGYPFLPTIENAIGMTGVVYAPVLTEFGVELLHASVSSHAFTGSTVTGEERGYTCSDWSSLSGNVDLGVPAVGTTGFWGSLSVGNCVTIRALLCLEVGSGAALPQWTIPGRLAFMTSAKGPGKLDQWPVTGIGGAIGIDAGDAICRSLAGAAGLPYPQTFKAWLSTDTINAVDRFTIDGPWRRVDGVPFADSIADLVSGRPFTSLGVTEFGGYSHERVFTGTLADGTAHPDTCSNWDSASGFGIFGFSSAAWSWWTETNETACSVHQSIYCLQDSTQHVIFWDSFEDGTLEAWSAVATGPVGERREARVWNAIDHSTR